jgi:hypothetical protein
VICSSQDHFRTGMRDLDHPVLADAKNIDIWHARKRDLQRAFPLDVTMVPSSMITITANGEHLTYGGFSPGETVCLGNFEFIVDYFGGLRRHLHGSTCSGTPSPWWAMIEDSVEEFLMASNEEGGGGLRPHLSQEAQHGHSARSCHNHTMDGECFDHSGQDNGSTVDSSTAAGYLPPF